MKSVFFKTTTFWVKHAEWFDGRAFSTVPESDVKLILSELYPPVRRLAVAMNKNYSRATFVKVFGYIIRIDMTK